MEVRAPCVARMWETLEKKKPQEGEAAKSLSDSWPWWQPEEISELPWKTIAARKPERTREVFSYSS